MKFRALFFSAVAALGLTATPLAMASSHREAPGISEDPAADNTDVWAWVEPKTHDKLYIVASWIPFEEPSGGPNFHKFSDNVLYEIHIVRGVANLDDAVTFQIKFKSTPFPMVDPADLTKPLGGGKEFFSQIAGSQQTYTLVRVEKGVQTVIVADVPVAPPNIGPRTNKIAYKIDKYDNAFAASFIKEGTDKIKVWAGPRDDGFYIDLARIFDLANILEGKATDSLSGFNTHAIAIEIPTALLTGTGVAPKEGGSDAQTLGIWASSARRKVQILRGNGNDQLAGPWQQVSRVGLPLINEVVIGLQDKDRYNRTTPKTDVANFAGYFLTPVLVRDAEAVGIYTALGVPKDTVETFKKDRLDIVDAINLKALPGHNIPLTSTGDVLRVDIGIDSGFPNGRPLIAGAKPNQEQADVTDVLLSLVLTKKLSGLSDGANSNDKNFLPVFPYLALPWEGFSEGHGKAAP